MEWEAYDQLEPIGVERQEFMLALISSTLTNVAISALGKKGTKLTNALDFLPKWDSEGASEKTEESSQAPQSVEEQKKVMETIARLCGGGKKSGRIHRHPVDANGGRHHTAKDR